MKGGNEGARVEIWRRRGQVPPRVESRYRGVTERKVNNRKKKGREIGGETPTLTTGNALGEVAVYGVARGSGKEKTWGGRGGVWEGFSGKSGLIRQRRGKTHVKVCWDERKSENKDKSAGKGGTQRTKTGPQGGENRKKGYPERQEGGEERRTEENPSVQAGRGHRRSGGYLGQDRNVLQYLSRGET